MNATGHAIQFVCIALIGGILGAAGITFRDWSLYAILVLVVVFGEAAKS